MRVLLVCLGNICRSPVAEAALRRSLAAAGVADVEVASAGTDVWYPGEAPEPRMVAAAARLGLELDGAAHQVTAEDLAGADLVLAMDRRNLADLERLAPGTAVRLYRSFGTPGDARDVPDPFVGEAGFDDVAAIAIDEAAHITRWLAERGDPPADQMARRTVR
jgi:protein-tyrosine phosphatase